MTDTTILASELFPVEQLKPHPQNYRSHPDDQLEHIMASIRVNGFYRNIVVANDDTVLAGHGVVQAAKKMGMERVPIVRVDHDADSPMALKILAGDNYISHLAENDDRALTDLLKAIATEDDLEGTGFDEQMLAALAMVTRPKSELTGVDAAAEWAGAGMPAYESPEGRPRIVISFDSEEEREEIAKSFGYHIQKSNAETWAIFWGKTEQDDSANAVWKAEEDDAA